MGNAADGVAPQGKVHNVFMFQQEASRPLKVGVRLIFVHEDRYRPALLFGPGNLAIPVSTFDETDPEPAPVPFGPTDELRQILLAVQEIGLKGNGDMGLVLEFFLLQEFTKDRKGQILVGVLFHVYGQGGSKSGSLPKDRPESVFHYRHRVGIQRIKTGTEG